MNKKILLGVTGSISAYKSYDLVRELVKKENEVVVVLTSGALEFCHQKTFSYLGAKAVFTHQSDFNHIGFIHHESPSTVLHVDLVKWAELMIIAPLSANKAQDLACNRANDLLTSIFCAWDEQKPVYLFPAMNTKMLEKTNNSLQYQDLLKKDYIWNHPTKSGELICKDEGSGKLADVNEMISLIQIGKLARVEETKAKHVLISTGAAKSYLDDVRYLTNPSSGLTGLALTEYFLSQGYEVSLIGPSSLLSHSEIVLNRHPRFHFFEVETNQDYLLRTQEQFSKCHVFISAAALCDIDFEIYQGKLKKNDLKDTISIRKSIDVLANIIKDKKPSQKIVGFAAEADLSSSILEEKLQRKPVDLLVANKVSAKKKIGFQQPDNDYMFISSTESKKFRLTKNELGREIERCLQ